MSNGASSTAPQYNSRCAGVKRLMREAAEMREPSDDCSAAPLDDNLFEWHFTIRGPPDTDFEGGVYHGRIIFPPDYPMKPPEFLFLTRTGRFEINTKVCLSISGYHPETWLPSWSIRTALTALIAFMPTPANGAVGGLDYPTDARRRFAKASLSYKCETCGQCMGDALSTRRDSGVATEDSTIEQNEMPTNSDDSLSPSPPVQIAPVAAAAAENEGASAPRRRRQSSTAANAPAQRPTPANAAAVVDESAPSLGMILVLIVAIVFFLLFALLAVRRLA